MVNRLTWCVVSSASVALLLSACGGMQLEETHGTKSMSELTVDGNAVILDDLSQTMRIDSTEGSIEGRAGCNEFQGTFTYDSGILTPADDIYFTIVGCSLSEETTVDEAMRRLMSGPIQISGDEESMTMSGNGVRVEYVRLEE